MSSDPCRAAIGLGGQTISVIPSHQMVVVAQREVLDTQTALPADIIRALLSR